MNLFKLNEVKEGFFGLMEARGYSRVSSDKIVKEAYLGNEDVYSIVSKFARLCATTPLKLMNGDKVVLDTDPIYKKFYDNWNVKYGKEESLYQLFVNLLLHGDAYILNKSDTIGFIPEEQWVLPSQAINTSQHIYNFFEEPPFYQFNDGTKIYKYFPEELIIIKYYDPSLKGHEGLSPLQSVWNTVESSNNRAVAESSMLENRGISGFISPKASSGDAGAIGFSQKVIETVRASFSSLIGGAKKFNKIEVIERGADFTQIGMDANDMKIIEMRLNHVRSICNTYGVPSLLFNDYQSRTHANYKEAMKAMYTDAVIPQLNLFKNQYEKKYLNRVNILTGQNYWIKIALEEIEPLKEDLAVLRTSVLAQLEKNLITKREAREMLGLPGEVEAENVSGIDRLLSMSPLLANGLVATLSQEDRDSLLREIGIIK